MQEPCFPTISTDGATSIYPYAQKSGRTRFSASAKNIGTQEMNNRMIHRVNFGSILHPMLVADITGLMMRRHTFDHALQLSSLLRALFPQHLCLESLYLHSFRELHEQARSFPVDPRVNEVDGLHGPFGLVELNCNVTACRRHIPQTSAVHCSRVFFSVTHAHTLHRMRGELQLSWFGCQSD